MNNIIDIFEKIGIGILCTAALIGAIYVAGILYEGVEATREQYRLQNQIQIEKLKNKLESVKGETNE